MEYEQAKASFIQAWATLGTHWGINRTMAQIHALLLIDTEPLSTEQIMEELMISRGNANMNTRALLDWGLVQKELKPGKRKEFFLAKKDVSLIAQQIAKERKKRELDPLIEALKALQEVKGSNAEVKAFRSITQEMLGFARQADTLLNAFINNSQRWFFKVIRKISA